MSAALLVAAGVSSRRAWPPRSSCAAGSSWWLAPSTSCAGRPPRSALACETIWRESAGSAPRRLLEVQLDRLRAGLADLEARAADGGPPPAARPSSWPRRPCATGPWRDRAGTPLRVAGRPAPAVLDRGRLAQALGNMVANAAEHGVGGVEVRGRTTSGAVRIEVRNQVAGDGAGARRPLPGAMLDRGRGLAIASQAARDLGGRLLVSIDGERAVAVLELPLRSLEPSAGPSGAETA